MKTNETEKPLAQRITQGTLETQVNHARLSPEGTPTVQVYDSERRNVAVFIAEPDGELFTESVRITHETGKTPAQLAAENARLREALAEMMRCTEAGDPETMTDAYMQACKILKP